MPNHYGNGNNMGQSQETQATQAATGVGSEGTGHTGDTYTPPESNGDTMVTSSLDALMLEGTEFVVIDRSFGSPDDYIETHIYNTNNQLVHSNHRFNDYTLPETQGTKIQINPRAIINDSGIFTGNYKLKLNIFKHQIFNSPTTHRPFQITEISSDRKEIRAVAPGTNNNILDTAVNGFIADIESSVYFKEYFLNFGNDFIILAVNVLLNKDPLTHEILFKLGQPLNASIPFEGMTFSVVEEISDAIVIPFDLGDPIIGDNTINLSGPNFQIDIKQNNSIPSAFKSYNDILQYDITSSYQHLLNKITTNNIDLGIKYDYIPPVSESSENESYHFENFTHFSSAVERLKNFKYKLQLIEGYESDIKQTLSIPNSTSESAVTVVDRSHINSKIEKIIKGFDGYEQFLYYGTGSNLYSWPKYTGTKPFKLFSISSSEAKTWIGSEDPYNTTYYGGQLFSASLFDRQNVYSLVDTLPGHIKDNSDNSFYISFVNMIGQHFDGIWTYIKAISNLYDSNNNTGISKDLVYYQLKSLGIDTFDQFENSNLIEYILGEGNSGSIHYSADNYYNYTSDHPSASVEIGTAVSASETIITASNEGSIPKGDISKEIWKRLYHNAPYLLKTKGTERGLKALMSCYGVPHTILNVKEFGGSTTVTGPLKDLKTADHYKTFSYEKSGLALKGDSGTGGYFIKTDWSGSLISSHFTSEQLKKKTVEFRIKPAKSSTQYHLFSLSGSSKGPDGEDLTQDIHLLLDPYTGPDISSSNDANTYGRLLLYQGTAASGSTNYFPIYNGDFWNIFITAEHLGGAGHYGLSDGSSSFGAYQANFNKNIFSYKSTSYITNIDMCWGGGTGSSATEAGSSGSKFAFFGGVPANPNSSYNHVDGLRYSGSLQEIKYHFGEVLSDSTLKKHALEPFMYSGNTPSSSYEHVVIRLPLGSNDQEDSSSFHPHIQSHYLGNSGVGYSEIEDGFDVGSYYGNESVVDSDMSSQKWEEVIETHHLPTPDTVGISTTSEKVRIDEGTIEDNVLSPFIKRETSTLDRQPQDFKDLGVYFSPTEEINEDILYTLGSFRMDDYIGNPLPSAQSASFYEDLKDIKDIYFKKVEKKYNYWDYIKQIQRIDHTLFKMIENFVPFSANLKTGLLFEPSFLERTKLPRTHNPQRSDGQTMIVGSHQTFEFGISTEYGENRLYQMRSSSAADFGQKSIIDDDSVKGQWDPGSYVTYHSNPSAQTSSRAPGHYPPFKQPKDRKRADLGTNATIEVYDDYLDPFRRSPNDENNMDCQAPIKPFSGSSQEKLHPHYTAHESSVLLGNVIKGKESDIYVKLTDYGIRTASLYPVGWEGVSYSEVGDGFVVEGYVSNNVVTHSLSLEHGIMKDAEFDDALIDQASWKNSRYDGSRLKARFVNKYSGPTSVWGGDESYQSLPVLNNHSTALYIANSVIGGTEDPQFATIQNHSYVNIEKILIINLLDDSVQVLDKSIEPFQEFHRFITNDFPTGTKCAVKILDESIGEALQGRHRVKMNKGLLYKTFEFKHGGEYYDGSTTSLIDTYGSSGSGVLVENNSMYLYTSGGLIDNFIQTGSQMTGAEKVQQDDQLRFRYGLIEMFPGGANGPQGGGANRGHMLRTDRIGPSFASSSIIQNKYTNQYYSGSFGFINHNPISVNVSNSMAELLASTGLGSASRFLGLDSLRFLSASINDENLTEQEKTEMHITFFQGTKDFTKGANDPVSSHDERSIGTFEVDQHFAQLGIEQGDSCNYGLPTNHELVFKGVGIDDRFRPTTGTHLDTIQSAHIKQSGSTAAFNNGCAALDQPISTSAGGCSSSDPECIDQNIQPGINLDRVENMRVYVQGGALGEIGWEGVHSGSSGDYGDSQLPNLNTDNFFSGSFHYEMSFLDKQHTLILNLDKDAELPNGIGNKGVLIIPNHIHTAVAFNLDWYLNKAGILNSSTNTTTQVNPDSSIID